MYQPEELHTIATSAVDYFGAVAVGRGVDLASGEPVYYLGSTRLMRAVEIAIASEGRALATVPTWAILAIAAPVRPVFDHHAAAVLA